MNRTIERLALILSALFLFAFIPQAAAQSGEPGTIRVLLSEYSRADRIDIGIYGSYLVNDSLSFQSGTKVIVSCETGSLMMYYEGAVFYAGDSLGFVRHEAQPGKENGLRLDSELNLMEGDLLLTVKDGKLWPVLRIGIEDYLKGVVPYEMNDSFPLEALKAQAVAARTYAMRALRTDRDFDVYNNTMDQVFRGYEPQNIRAFQAIEMTKGICLAFGQELAQCYYTASNGGQTESAENAWGREYLPYLIVKDDPYDAENPQSIRKSYRVAKRPDTLQAELKSFLIRALLPLMGEMGYDDNEAFVGIEGITGVSADTPRFAPESRLMTMLHFDVLVSGRRLQTAANESDVSLFSSAAAAPQATMSMTAWGPVERLDKPLRLSFPLYPDMERMFGLSINIKENETVSVAEDSDAFFIRTGRYGHGVGMSQRGAEWMAGQYGKSYRDILSFYYPGTVENLYLTTPDKRGTLNPGYLTTPGPKPTATPRPTLIPLSVTPGPGQWTVHVTGIAKNSTLNLRALPNVSSEVLYQLFYGQQLLVISQEAEGWLKVTADGIEGYVMSSFTQPVR